MCEIQLESAFIQANDIGMPHGQTFQAYELIYAIDTDYSPEWIHTC